MPYQSSHTPTTECISPVLLGFHREKPVVVTFDAPQLSSDAGVILLRQMDDKLGLSQSIAPLLTDDRNPIFVVHTRLEQLQQRVYQIALGYEDCNDATRLRHDPLLKLACDSSPNAEGGLSSQPTLTRFENAMDASSINKLSAAFEDQYVAALAANTTEVILDIDTTDDPTHGQQQLTFFHGFYDQHMYHPLMVFDARDGHLITVLLRPGNSHASRSAMLVLRRVIRKIKSRFPSAQVLVRGDAGFCVPRILLGMEALNDELGEVDYLFGMAQNSRLLSAGSSFIKEAKNRFECGQTHVRMFGEFAYAAESWPRTRRIVMKAEHSEKGSNPRFVVTSLQGFRAGEIYDGYCDRGQCENYIKDFKNALAADRLSCTNFVANAFRLWLHALAYRLMHALRQECCTQFATVCFQMDTLRLRLLKVAALVVESVRRVSVRLPSAFPFARLFADLSARLQP